MALEGEKRRADLKERLLSAAELGRKEGRKARQRNRGRDTDAEDEAPSEKEGTDMATSTRDKAEAMTSAALKDVLKSKGVKGYSGMSKAELVEEYLTATKPKPAKTAPPKKATKRTNGSSAGPRRVTENPTVGKPIEWSNKAGDFTGSSSKGLWYGGGCRPRVRAYLEENTKLSAEKIKAELTAAFEQLRAGKSPVKVADVTIKIVK